MNFTLLLIAGLLAAPVASAQDTARAASKVFFAGVTAGEAGSAVARATGLPKDGLEAQNLRALLSGVPPRVVGPGEAEICSGPPVRAADLQRLVSHGVQTIKDARFAQGLVDLAAAEAAVVCLTEPLPLDEGSSPWSQLHFWRGVAAYRQGDLRGARDAFGQALTLQPSLQWPDSLLDSNGLSSFSAARTESARTFPVVLEIVAGDQPVRVDGVLIEDPTSGQRLALGEHLVQVGDEGAQTVRVTLSGGGRPVLVFPDLIPEDAVDWAGDNVRRGWLSTTLTAVLGEGEPLYVVTTEGHVWSGATGDGRWTRLDVRSLHAGPFVMITGATAATAGVAGMVTTYALHRRDYDVPGREEVYRRASEVVFPAFEVTTYVGAAVFGAGAALTLRGLTTQPVIVVPMNGGGWVGLAYNW